MEKSKLQNLTPSLIFKKLPGENDRPIGENSPNLVTMPTVYIFEENKLHSFYSFCQVCSAQISIPGIDNLVIIARI
jgi:hypothetical protein